MKRNIIVIVFVFVTCNLFSQVNSNISFDQDGNILGSSNAGVVETIIEPYIPNPNIPKSAKACSVPTAADVARCGTGTVTLTASGSSGVYQWWDAALGGNLLGTNASYTTPSISTTTTYYVEALCGTSGFIDDFEDGNVTEYSGVVNFSASTANPYNGSYSGRITGSCPGHYCDAYLPFTAITPPYISFWVYASTAGASQGYFVVQDGTVGVTGTQMVMFYIKSGTTLTCVVDGGSYVEKAVTIGTWHHVEFKNIDWIAHTFDIWYDGVVAGSNIVFRGQASANNCDRIFFYNYANATAYYDDIQIGEISNRVAVDAIVYAPPTSNAGIDASMCETDGNYTVGGSATNYSSVSWFTSGTGTFANSTALNTAYTPSAADILSGSVNLTLQANGNAPCGNASNFMVLTIISSATSDAGIDASMCETDGSYTVNGSATNYSSVLWTTSGTGTFANSIALNTAYTPSAADILSGSVNLTLQANGNAPCGNTSNFMVLNIISSATSDAGIDDSMCESSGSYTVNGSATDYATILWSTSGTGTFANSTALNTAYTPSAADILSGSVNLTLQANGNAPCGNASNFMVLTIISSATSDAGIDASMCETDGSYTVNGSATNYSSVLWTTSGTGTFANSIALNTAYTPSAADILSGSVNLTLQANGNAPCGNTSNFMVLNIISSATSDAGIDDSMCESSGSYTVNGSATDYATILWSTSGTGTFANSTALITAYTPSAADILAGNVTLTLQANGNSPCGNVSNSMLLTIISSATSDAGIDDSMCESSGSYTVNGNATDYTNVSWSTSGTGTFANSTALSTAYTPSAADILAGNVTLTLQANGNAPCGNTSNFMVLNIISSATSDAGIDDSMCESSGSYTVNGSATDYATILWSTSGTGTFANSTALITAYTPSAADILAGNVTLTLQANGNSPCGNVSNSMLLTIISSATSDAGIDDSMCETDVSYTVNGNATNYSTILWSTSGTGTFANSAALITAYTPSAADILAGIVTLTLQANGNAPCANVTTDMDLTIEQAPIISAGVDAAICEGEDFTLSGTMSGSPSSVTWTSLGDGIFDNATLFTATYTPGTTDITNASVVLTLSSDDPTGPCPIVTDDITLTINPNPVIDSVITTLVTNCISPNGSIYIYATSSSVPLQYSIDNGSTFATDSIFINQNNGNYDIIVLDVYSCSDTSFAVISNSAGPIIDTVYVTEPLCNGDSTAQLIVEVLNMDSLTYTIDSWSTYQSDSTFNNLYAGIYNVEIVDSLGCTDSWIAIIAEPTELILDTVQVDNAVCGATGYAEVIATGGISPYSYQWEYNNDTTTSISNIPAGSYNVSVTDNNGCIDSITVIVDNAGGQGVVEIIDSTMVSCNGFSDGSATATMIGGTSPYTYLWSNTSSDTTAIADSLSLGIYYVTISDTYGCTGTDTVSITEPSSLQVLESIQDVLCYGDSTGSLSATVSGATPPYSYLWDNGDSLNTISGLIAGIYGLTVTDNNNCNLPISVQITQPNSELQINNYNIIPINCFGDIIGSIELTVAGGTRPYNYQWTGFGSDSLISNIGAGNYEVIISDTNNCTLTDTFTILPAIQMIVTDSVYYLNSLGNIELTIDGEGAMSYTYLWDDINNSTSEDIFNLISGDYTVIITDANLCEYSDTYTITIPFEIPTLFTPNGDGFNDTWNIKNVGSFASVSIEIFNRWGSVVFTYEGTGLQYLSSDEQWDGTYNGSQLPVGAYVYILNLGDQESYNGVVSIKR